MGNVEALALYGCVGVERHVEPAAGGHDRARQTTAAQPSQLTRARILAVEDLQSIVRAFHVRFQFEVVERLHADITTTINTHAHNTRQHSRGATTVQKLGTKMPLSETLKASIA